MKIFTKLTAALAFILLISTSAVAQKNFMTDAKKAFDGQEYFNSIELYKKAYTKAKKKEDKAFIVFRTAECYRLIGDNKQAEAWYIKAIKANYTDPKAKLYLADAKARPRHFNPRCPMKAERCVSEVPSLETVAEGHRAACHFRNSQV